MTKSKSITVHVLFLEDWKEKESMITEGQEETFGVKDLLIIFIMVLMSQLYLRQNLESGILKYVQCIVLYFIYASVKNYEHCIEEGLQSAPTG